MSGAYYNENDAQTAEWLRELIRRNLIAPGDVDTRSIEDVKPVDLRGYTQCHFFAGIGGWSRALRLAGWPDDLRCWTGSCPCQPFSAAGAGAGFADQRHLWPAWLHLIAQCSPAVIFGEQVASNDALLWWDLVSADLEGQAYACTAADLCAAGIGAPHIRQRLFWVAHSDGFATGRKLGGIQRAQAQAQDVLGCSDGFGPGRGVPVHGMADADRDGRAPRGAGGEALGHWETAGADRGTGRLADTNGEARGRQARGAVAGGGAASPGAGPQESGRHGGDSGASPLHGFWRAADWLGCRDGKWRPVEPGTFPLAHGLPARVGRLRGYGNAIVPQVAAEFVRAYIDVRAAA